MVAVHLCVGRRGFPNGDAFVRFANYQDFRRALYECNRREIQGRYIELFPSTSDEWELDKNEVTLFSPLAVIIFIFFPFLSHVLAVAPHLPLYICFRFWCLYLFFPMNF